MPRPAAPFQLTPDQQAELRARLRQRTMAPRLRVRLQCMQLRDQGWPVPQVAQQLAVSQATVRRALGRVVAVGWARWPTGPEPDHQRWPPCLLGRPTRPTQPSPARSRSTAGVSSSRSRRR